MKQPSNVAPANANQGELFVPPAAEWRQHTAPGVSPGLSHPRNSQAAKRRQRILPLLSTIRGLNAIARPYPWLTPGAKCCRRSVAEVRESQYLSWALIALFLMAYRPVLADSPPPVGNGGLNSVAAAPTEIKLSDRDAVQQIVVTGRFENTGVRDLTTTATYRVSDPKIATVGADGYLLPVGNGATKIAIEADGRTTSVQIQVEGFDQERSINFANEIVPILTKLGCNAGGCHGKADGQNGFKLSLLGFDPVADYDALVHEARGRRILEDAPEHSLLLLKSSGQLGHGGGKPLKLDSAEYRLVEQWIRTGVPFGNDDDPQVVSINVEPAHRLLASEAPQQVAVTAQFSDGTSRDVTRTAEYRTNDPELVDASETGLITTTGRSGEGSVMIRYLGYVSLFRATVPRTTHADTPASPHTPINFVDELAFAKQRQLGYVASDLCTDGEFLRRASLDIIGTLPTTEEVTAFLGDVSSNKREKLIDALLSRPEYATYWSLKWGDILRVRGGSNDNTKTKIEGLNTRAVKFRDWIHKQLADNRPYNEIVRDIITVDGPTTGPETSAPILWYLELRNAEGLVEDTAQAFLGTRVQCARCHHHPFEKWSQQDYWSLAGFFSHVEWRVGVDNKGAPVKDGKPVRDSESARVGQLVALNKEKTLSDPQGNVYDKPTPLGGSPIEAGKSADMRNDLVDWIVQPDNPFFARALVNRYWGHFFGRGIVEPVDDMRETNPPSNPELLDALAQDFVSNGFDLKQVVRTICTSRTYQLSSAANETNRDDLKHGSRFLPQRLSAEVLYDALDQVTGQTSKFRVIGVKTPTELEIRAIARPHMRVTNYFIDTFGINKRDSACECGRDSTMTLAQRVLLLNNGGVRAKLTSRAEQLFADERPVKEKVNDAYLAFFSRRPTDEERQACVEYVETKLADPRKAQEAYYDLLWALANSKEFIFQH